MAKRYLCHQIRII